MEDLQRDLWVYLGCLLAGCLLYEGAGYRAARLTIDLNLFEVVDFAGLGFEIWVLWRLNLFGFFLGCLGLIGIIINLRRAKMLG